MYLRVTPSHLEGFARQVSRAADDAAEACGYVRKHASIKPMEQGLLTRMFDLHGHLAGTVTDTLARLQEILAASSSELGKAAHYYRVTDVAEAAKMDAVRRSVR